MQKKYMKFGALTNTKYQSKLAKGVYWVFRPVTTKMEIEYNRFFATMERPSWLEIMLFQLAQTFGGTNLNPKETFGVDGYEEIPNDITPEELTEILRELPIAFTAELWDALKDHYPFWGPAYSEEEEENLEKSSAS